jgi:hypothetical protein
MSEEPDLSRIELLKPDSIRVLAEQMDRIRIKYLRPTHHKVFEPHILNAVFAVVPANERGRVVDIRDGLNVSKANVANVPAGLILAVGAGQ